MLEASSRMNSCRFAPHPALADFHVLRQGFIPPDLWVAADLGGAAKFVWVLAHVVARVLFPKQSPP